MPTIRFLAITLLGGALAFTLALQWLPAARIGETYVPMEFDSFYHARRIVDAIRDPADFYEFDRLNYAPEGTWISWPWAFDYGLARFTSVAMRATGIDDPMRILVFVPPAWTFVNVALTLAVGTAVGLSVPLRVALVLAFACSPLTQLLHGAGRIDHHFMEYSFVQATLLALILWLERPGSRARAATLGAVLGLSQSVQNGLFILQLPVLVTLALLWWRGRAPATRPPTIAFAAGLVGTTALLVSFSEPFRAGLFDYTLLSRFHLYVAAVTSALVVAMSATACRATAMAGVLGLGATLAIPVAGQVLSGTRFLAASLHDYDRVTELKTVIGHTSAGAFTLWESTTLYSALVWLAPAVLAWASWKLVKSRDDVDTGLAIFTLFGLSLMHQQFRLHYFGSFTLVLPLLVVFQSWFEGAAARARVLGAGALAAGLALAHVPCVDQLLAVPPIGLSPLYGSLRGMYLTMGELCARDQGVLLADRALGNFIRYHSDCAVMGSNMLIDAHQATLVERMESLMNGSLDELRTKAPWVKYVFVMRSDTNWGQPTDVEREANDRGLRRELLAAEIPEGVHVVQEASMQEDGRQVPFARLLDLRRSGRGG